MTRPRDDSSHGSLAGLVRLGLVRCEDDARVRAGVGPSRSRTVLARRREPFSDAGLRIVARPCRECSPSVCSVGQQQSPGGALTPRGADMKE
jgi:hypothetical protein